MHTLTGARTLGWAAVSSSFCYDLGCHQQEKRKKYVSFLSTRAFAPSGWKVLDAALSGHRERRETEPCVVATMH